MGGPRHPRARASTMRPTQKAQKPDPEKSNAYIACLVVLWVLFAFVVIAINMSNPAPVITDAAMKPAAVASDTKVHAEGAEYLPSRVIRYELGTQNLPGPVFDPPSRAWGLPWKEASFFNGRIIIGPDAVEIDRSLYPDDLLAFTLANVQALQPTPHRKVAAALMKAAIYLLDNNNARPNGGHQYSNSAAERAYQRLPLETALAGIMRNSGLDGPSVLGPEERPAHQITDAIVGVVRSVDAAVSPNFQPENGCKW